MKAKLTPLNIVSALALVLAVMYFWNRKSSSQHVNVSGILAGFCFLVAVIAFVSDQIFRRFIPSLKKLWIVEGVLIAFAIILIFIIKVSTS